MIDYERFIAYFNTHDTFSNNSGIRLVKMSDGYAEAVLEFSPASCNFMGTMHGDALATLADIAAGSALYMHKRLCVTLDSSMRYIRPVTGDARAVARQVVCGARIAVVNVEIFDEADVLCASVSISMYMTKEPLKYGD
jgi:acyl-CoA thioesterase